MKLILPYIRDGEEELFSYKDNSDDVIHIFPVQAILRFIMKNRPHPALSLKKLSLMKDQTPLIRRQYGIEQDRLDRLCFPYLQLPILIANGIGQHGSIVIDGNHRYVKLAESGVKETFCFVIEPELWRECLIPNHIVKDAFPVHSGVNV